MSVLRLSYASRCRGIFAHIAIFVAGPMALIDRNFQGFGKELFTDAGKYVIHFGDKPMEAANQASKTIQAAHPDKPAPPVTAVAKYRNPDMQIIATSTADQLVRPSNVSRLLSVTKRAFLPSDLVCYVCKHELGVSSWQQGCVVCLCGSGHYATHRSPAVGVHLYRSVSGCKKPLVIPGSICINLAE